MLNISLAYYYNIGQFYKKSKVNVSGISKGWLRYTIINKLKINKELYKKGSDISYIFYFKDLLRDMLDKADSFRKATNIAVYYSYF
jgi:hypothetical protein